MRNLIFLQWWIQVELLHIVDRGDYGDDSKKKIFKNGGEMREKWWNEILRVREKFGVFVSDYGENEKMIINP